MGGLEDRYGKINVCLGTKESEIDFRKGCVVGDSVEAWAYGVDAFIDDVHESKGQKISNEAQRFLPDIIGWSQNSPRCEDDKSEKEKTKDREHGRVRCQRLVQGLKQTDWQREERVNEDNHHENGCQQPFFGPHVIERSVSLFD